ncbi:MAG: hypothetical protein WAV16_02050 [Candidatus Moraniibacteriota bacterium]
MPFVEVGQYVPADTIRKRLGKPNGFGWIMFGWSEFGDDNYYQGVYQQRRKRKWNGVNGFIIDGRQRNFIMKPAWPVQPVSEARDAQQLKFKNALLAWQALTESKKAEYNKIATKKSKRGYDYFMSKQLKSF